MAHTVTQRVYKKMVHYSAIRYGAIQYTTGYGARASGALHVYALREIREEQDCWQNTHKGRLLAVITHAADAVYTEATAHGAMMSVTGMSLRC